MAKQNLLGQSVSTSERVKRLSKTHQDYWKSRLERHCYTREGDLCEVNEWSVRIQHLGKRKSFTLHSSNKEVAAIKARNIYQDVVNKGWDAALGEHDPEMIVTKDAPSLGEFLSEVRDKSGLRCRTLRAYSNCFRTIVAGIFGIDGGKEKFNYRSGGCETWRCKVDAVKLAAITPDKVQKWKVAFINRAGDSPSAQQSAKRSVNTYLRCARSLFSPKITRFLTMRLPKPLPFEGVDLEKGGSMRYKSTINVQVLIAAANGELKSDHREAYKIFLLGLFAGLRRAEIDGLEWSSIDWESRAIRVDYTDVLHVKSDGSSGIVEVDAEVLDELRALKVESKSPFVIGSHRKPRPNQSLPYYRCQHHFRFLTDWLRSKGVAANKPLHELRKELGALIASKHGIFAAAHILRHSDISTTSRHYADQKQRVTAGLGHFLRTDIKVAETA